MVQLCYGETNGPMSHRLSQTQQRHGGDTETIIRLGSPEHLLVFDSTRAITSHGKNKR